MPRNDLPTYAIVELLIRIARYNKTIGDYKGHRLVNAEVWVKTTGGALRFPQSLVMQQFENPELINDKALLKQALGSFRTTK